MVDRLELEARGWTEVPSIASRDELFQIARSLGSPVISPTGEATRRLVIKTFNTPQPSTS